jgi:hypothetical protein
MIGCLTEIGGFCAMAIAPSKLGEFVSPLMSSDDALVRGLREADLIKVDVSDDALIAVFRRAREEHQSLSESMQTFNSPHERVRVFLEPYLNDKGRKWAVPLVSLVERQEERRPWWKFWD